MPLRAFVISGGRHRPDLRTPAEDQERLSGSRSRFPRFLEAINTTTLSGELDPGPALSAEVSRRLLCDAGVVPVLEDAAGTPLDVGRRTRTIPGALRRALRARDRGCRFPGCTNRIVDAHHVTHWIDGGETSLANTLSLCRRHHGRLHEGRFTVQAREGAFEFFDEAGRELPAAGPPGGLLEAELEVLRCVSEEGRAVWPAWDGEPLDADAALDVLFRAPG